MEPQLKDETYIHSALNDGLTTRILRIESSLTRGFAGIQLLGNTSETCRDGKERARTALEHLGIFLPAQRLVMSMTPGDVKKEGNHLDLAMALGMASQVLKNKSWLVDPKKWLYAAELGLNGELRPVKGVISFALTAMSHGLQGIVVAEENMQELQVLAGLKLGRPISSPGEGEMAASISSDGEGTSEEPFQIHGFRCLKEVLSWLKNGEYSAKVYGSSCSFSHQVIKSAVDDRSDDLLSKGTAIPNFDDMLLSPEQFLVAVTAGAGMHSLLLRGCPGTGKSMFAQRLTSILPPMAPQVHIEVLRVYSQITERIPKELLMGRAPFRAPHHQASAPAILGTPDVPGELGLAHGGVLFLDEFPELRRDILESLREPLETGEIRVSRAKKKAEWLCRVILVAACNNCPCGWIGSTRRMCRCSMARIQAYRGRLSGPILERIDMHVNFPEASGEVSAILNQSQEQKLGDSLKNHTQTELMRAKVSQARNFAMKRNQKLAAISNSQIRSKDLGPASGLAPDQLKALVSKVLPAHVSKRALIRCLRVARTLADLEERNIVHEKDLAQAFSWQEDVAAYDRGETSHVAGMTTD